MDDVLGPNAKSFFPPNLGEDIKMLMSVKTITLLTGEEHLLPKDLVIVPFTSLNSKALTKYFMWEEESRRGGYARAAILILFNDFDDVIFYKYKDDLKPVMEKAIERILEVEHSESDESELKPVMEDFYNEAKTLLEELKQKETAPKAEEAFPDVETKQKPIDFRFKVILCGDPSVGKTSTILRFTYNAFTRTYMPTIGTNISEKNVEINLNDKDYVIQLILWDIAGQTKFQTMRRHFYQGSEGILLVFDLSHRKSFDSIKNWYKDILTQLGSDAKIIGFLLGNKRDLVDQRAVSEEEGQQLANELKFGYYESSALTGENVNETFEMIAETLLKTKLFT